MHLKKIPGSGGQMELTAIVEDQIVLLNCQLKVEEKFYNWVTQVQMAGNDEAEISAGVQPLQIHAAHVFSCSATFLFTSFSFFCLHPFHVISYLILYAALPLMCSRSRVFSAYKPLIEPLRNGPYSYLCTSSTLPELTSVTASPVLVHF